MRGFVVVSEVEDEETCVIQCPACETVFLAEKDLNVGPQGELFRGWCANLNCCAVIIAFRPRSPLFLVRFKENS